MSVSIVMGFGVAVGCFIVWLYSDSKRPHRTKGRMGV
jgi:hypothetical protein